MTIKGILFDLYGTLIDINTDESLEEIYRGIAHFLTYQGIYLHRGEVRNRYWEILRQQKEESKEEYSEIDVEAIWKTFLKNEGLEPLPIRQNLAVTLAQLFRGISRTRLQLYPQVKRILDELRSGYLLGIISDAQPCYALPEIKAVGLEGYFDPVIISAPRGYRKPDPRLWGEALQVMKLNPSQVIYVGDDMYRDIFGAQRVGIKTILVDLKQGAKSYENITPDFFAARFEQVLEGIVSADSVH
jgi:putative hydrolase of the HAD superfamily